MVSLIIDGIIIVVCLIIIIVETVRGFIKSIMNFGSTIAAFFVAYFCSKPLGAHIDHYLLGEKVAAWIDSTIRSLTVTDGGYDLTKLTSDMPGSFMVLIQKYSSDAASIQAEIDGGANATEEMVANLSQTISSHVSLFFSNVIAWLILFFVTMLLLRLIGFILDKIFKTPALKTANQVLGCVVGIAISLVVASILSLVAVTVVNALSTTYPETFNQAVIDNSLVVKFFAKYSLLNIAAFLMG